jgi:hypothetical protein
MVTGPMPADFQHFRVGIGNIPVVAHTVLAFLLIFGVLLNPQIQKLGTGDWTVLRIVFTKQLLPKRVGNTSGVCKILFD